jgi:diguanylate cyclase (GGDEF)-like protein
LYKLPSRYYKIQVLVIDPLTDGRIDLFQLLGRDKYVITSFTTGEQGWQHLQAMPTDVVVCQFHLPDLSSLALCQRLKANLLQPQLAHIHFLLVLDDRSEMSIPEQQRLGREAGVDGFLRLPLTPEEVQTRFQTGSQLRLTSSALNWTNQKLATLADLVNKLGLMDAVCNCLNRQAMLESLPAILAECNANNLSLGLLRIDIDRYSELQSTYSPRVLNEVLQAIVGRLQNNSPAQSLLYRRELNSFLAVTIDQSLQSAQEMAENLMAVIANHPIAVDYGLLLPITISIGGVVVLSAPQPQTSAQSLLDHCQAIVLNLQSKGGKQSAVVDLTG